MGDKSICELVEALKNTDEDVRQQAAIELEQTRDNKMIFEQLIEALNDNDNDVQCYAADGLGSLGDSRAVEPLLRVIESSSDSSFVAEAALDALREIGEPAVDPLVSVLTSDTDDLRPYAADVLGILGYKRAETTLTAATKDTDATVREAAAYALRKLSKS